MKKPKKEAVEETTEQKKGKEVKKLEKQGWIVASIAAGIIIIVLCAFFYAQSSNHFKYIGLDFEKTRMGEIILYRTNVPIIKNNALTELLTIDFRNNPKSLENIDVNLISEKIKLLSNNLTYISYNKSLKICEDNGLAAANLGGFLFQIGINAKGVIDDIDYINNTNLLYANCNTNPYNSVIYITNGDETKIEQTNVNCYKIIVKDCEILKATEKFQLELVEEYMHTLYNF